MPTPTPGTPQFTTDPAAALQSMAGSTTQQQQDAAALSNVVSDQMIQQYKASQAQPQAVGLRQQQGLVDQSQQQALGPQQAAQAQSAPPPFKMMPVASSTLSQVGYDQQKREMHVNFKSSPETYIFQEVSPKAFEGLLNARSKGLHFSQQIKGRYPFQKVKPIPPQL